MFSLKDNPVIKEILDEGERKGRQEGRQEGQIEGLQKSLSLTLQKRFGVLSKPFIAKIKAIESIRKLEEVLKTALTAENLAQVEKMLG